MSELFANLGGFRQPDVRMNQGPLPSVAGGPAGSNGTVDGVINGTGALLGGITPYAYGESARAGSDSNYQQIPHRVQYIVMPLHLPSQNGLSTHKVSHVVDNGDLAFVLNTRGRQWFGPGENVLSAGPVSLPLFANIEVVNYILACMQLAPNVAPGPPGKRSWTAIRGHLWKQAFDERKMRLDAQERAEHLFECVQYTLQNLFKPHGICAGSEKQGGQHEETWAPVQAAVNYTTTMTVDGQNRDLINYWHSMHICAGDRLILRLEPRNAGSAKNQPKEFQLTSYYKRPVHATISADKLYWQVVPHILHADAPLVADEQLAWHDYRLAGHWHIAQSFQGRRGFDTGAAAHKGAPLQVTFAPMFVPGDGGRRDDPFFTRDALNEFEVGTQAELERDAGECGLNPAAYDQLACEAFLKKRGVRLATIRTLFGKPSQANFVANMTATASMMGTAVGLAWIYKFAREYRLYRMQQYILRFIHSNHFEALLKGTQANTQKFIKKLYEQFGVLPPGDPRFVEWMTKLAGPEAVADALRDLHGGGGGRRGGIRDGGGLDILRHGGVVGNASAALEASFAAPAGLAAENTDKAVAPRKRGPKRSALFVAAAEDAVAADGEAAV
jgi:hypothetical protein